MGWFQPPTIVPNFKKTKKTPRKSHRKLAAVLAVPWMVDPRSKPTAPKRPDRPTDSWRRRPVDRPGRAHQGHPGALGVNGRELVSLVFLGARFGRCFPWKADGIRQFGGLRFVRFFCWNKMGLAMFFCQKA